MKWSSEFYDFFFEVLIHIDTKFAKFEPSIEESHDLLWLGVNLKSEFCHFVYKTNGKVWFLFSLGNQSICFIFVLFKMKIDLDKDLKQWKS